jgi:hypothetical protein
MSELLDDARRSLAAAIARLEIHRLRLQKLELENIHLRNVLRRHDINPTEATPEDEEPTEEERRDAEARAEALVKVPSLEEPGKSCEEQVEAEPPAWQEVLLHTAQAKVRASFGTVPDPVVLACSSGVLCAGHFVIEANPPRVLSCTCCQFMAFDSLLTTHSWCSRFLDVSPSRMTGSSSLP